MSKELSSESVQELSNDCDSWLQSVRRSSTKSIRESSGNCGMWLTVVSNGVSFGNWTTVSPLCVDQGPLTILVWKSCKSGRHDGLAVVCLTPESVGYEVPPGGLVNWCIGISDYSWFGRFYLVCKPLFLILTNCGRRNNKIRNKQKRNLICSFSSFDDFCAHCIGPNNKKTP